MPANRKGGMWGGKGRDPAKRAAKRQRQRAAGYSGVKKGQGSKVDRHGGGKRHRDDRRGGMKRA
jgi:hypothetical protein